MSQSFDVLDGSLVSSSSGRPHSRGERFDVSIAQPGLNARFGFVSRARVISGHLVRAFAYSLLGIFLLLVVASGFNLEGFLRIVQRSSEAWLEAGIDRREPMTRYVCIGFGIVWSCIFAVTCLHALENNRRFGGSDV